MEGLEVGSPDLTTETAHYAVSGKYLGVEFDVTMEVQTYALNGHRVVTGEFGDWYGDPPANAEQVEKDLVAEITRLYTAGKLP